MSMLLISGNFDAKSWVHAIHQIDAGINVEVWPQIKDMNAIEFVAVWRYPRGELLKFPNLKCISSMGAGVDQILSDTQRPADVPIVRVIDEMLTRDMTQYLVWAVLDHVRQMDAYRQQQSRHLWIPHGSPRNQNIGILGLGQLGKDTAVKLRDLGFSVAGWSKTPKHIDGIASFAGESQLDDFLARTDVLICLLPLTPETKGILNLQLFKKLRREAFLINVARGDHLVDEDLLIALREGYLSGACLDVFHAEPLAANNPMWSHPKIKITPHIASVTNPQSAATQLVANYRRALSNQPLLNLVNLNNGY